MANVRVDVTTKETPYIRIGGREKILEVVKVFYDKVYAHEWIGQYFANIPQEHIENQQVDFMSGSFNGPRVFCSRLPAFAHEHMMISDKLFNLRNTLLLEAMVECGVETDLQDI